MLARDGVACCLLLLLAVLSTSDASLSPSPSPSGGSLAKDVLPNLLATCNATGSRGRGLTAADCAQCMTSLAGNATFLTDALQQRIAACHGYCQNSHYFPPTDFTYAATAMVCSQCLTSPAVADYTACKHCAADYKGDGNLLGQCTTCLKNNPLIQRTEDYDWGCIKCTALTNATERSHCLNCLYKGLRSPVNCIISPSTRGRFFPLKVVVESSMTWQGYNTRAHERAFHLLVNSFVSIGHNALVSSCNASRSGSNLTTTFQLSSQKKVDVVLAHLWNASDKVAAAAVEVACGSSIALSGGSNHSSDSIVGIMYSCTPPAQRKKGWRYVSAVLCCRGPKAPSRGRSLSQAVSTQPTCADENLDIPAGGNCPYSSGMLLYCNNAGQDMSAYFRILDGVAFPYSPLAYMQAGSPTPTFSTSACCNAAPSSAYTWTGVLNGCPISPDVIMPDEYIIPTFSGDQYWTMVWSSLPSPASLDSTFLMSSSNNNFILYMWYSYNAGRPMLTLAQTLPALPSTLDARTTFSYWSAPTSTSYLQPGALQMNSDGNLVFTDINDNVVWQSSTSNMGTPPYTLALLNDGCLVVLDASFDTIWNSSIAAHNDDITPGMSTVMLSSPLVSGGDYSMMNSPNCGGSEDHECGAAKLDVGLRSLNGQFVFRLNGNKGTAQLLTMVGGFIDGGDNTAQFLFGLFLDGDNQDYKSGNELVLWSIPNDQGATDAWGDCNTTLTVMDAGYWQISLGCQNGETTVHWTSGPPLYPSYPPYKLWMQDDGNCVLYDNRGNAVWSTEQVDGPTLNQLYSFDDSTQALAGPVANAPSQTPLTTCSLPIGAIITCPPPSTGGNISFYLTTSSSSGTTVRAFSTEGYLLSQSPVVTFNAPAEWCSPSVVAGCPVSTREPIPGLLPGQSLQNMQLCQGTGSSFCLSVNQDSGAGYFSGCPPGQLCPVTPSSMTTLSANIAGDGDGALYFSLQLQPAVLVGGNYGCGFAIGAASSSSSSSVPLQYLTTCDSSAPAQQFFAQLSAPGSTSTSSTTSVQYPPATWFSIRSPAAPGYCLSNQGGAASFVPCDASDQSQWMATTPVVTINSQFNVTTSGTVATLTFQGDVDRFMGKLYGAFNDAFGMGGNSILNPGRTALQSSSSFPANNLNGQPGTVTVTFTASSFNTRSSAIPMETMRNIFLGTMYSQYNGSDANGGSIPQASYFTAGTAGASAITPEYLSVDISFVLTPPPPGGCPGHRSFWEAIVAGVATVVAGIATVGIAAGIVVTASTIVAAGTTAVAGGCAIASAVCANNA